jgi:hypothetical protein
MMKEVVYTETYKITLSAVIDGIEQSYGTATAAKLLNRIDGVVNKIVINPFIFQAIPLRSI